MNNSLFQKSYILHGEKWTRPENTEDTERRPGQTDPGAQRDKDAAQQTRKYNCETGLLRSIE